MMKISLGNFASSSKLPEPKSKNTIGLFLGSSFCMNSVPKLLTILKENFLSSFFMN